jgi:acetolactate synthase small subunit
MSQSTTPWTLVGQHAAVRFTLTAEAEPGVMARLLMPFTRRDLTPDSFECTRSGDLLRVEISMSAMPAEMVHLVEGNLRQSVGVTSLSCRREITGSVRRRAA